MRICFLHVPSSASKLMLFLPGRGTDLVLPGVVVRVCLVILFSSALYAGNAIKVKGIVTDFETGNPLEAVEVIVVNKGFKTLTGPDGTYQFSNLTPGMQKILISAPFYQQVLKEVRIFDGQDIVLNFRLGGKIIEMEEVIVTATLTEKDIKTVPATVEVITRKEIEDLGVENIHEALAESPGLNVQFGNGRTVSAGLRGLNMNQSLILVDGRRMAAGYGEQIHLDDIPINLLERIEVVRGPGSALYGSDAMGGVINFITRQPTNDLSGSFDVRYGQSRYGEAETPSFRGNIAGRKGRLGLFLSTSLSRRENYDRDKSTFFTDGDRRDKEAVAGKLSWDFGGNGYLTAGADFSRTSQRGNRRMSGGDGVKDTQWKRNSVFLEYEGRLPGNLGFTLQGYRSFFENDTRNFLLTSGESVFPMTPTGEPYHLEQDLRQLEGRVSGMLMGRHLVTMGAEQRWENRQDNDVDSDVNNSGLFLQDEIWLVDPLLLVLGVRFDRHSDFGSEFSPRLGTTYAPVEHFRLKGSYGEGFRAPSIYELYIYKDSPRNLVLPNLDLDAETSRGYELSAEGEVGHFSARSTFFRNDIDNMINTVQTGIDTIAQSGGSGGGGGGGGSGGGGGGGSSSGSTDTRPILKYENVDEAVVQGLELSATVKLPAGFSVSEEVVFLDTQDKNSGHSLFNKPKFINTVKVAYTIDRLGINGNFRIISTGSQYLALAEKVAGYTVCNLHISKSIPGNCKLHGGVNNLFNAEPYLPKFESTGTYFYMGISGDYH